MLIVILQVRRSWSRCMVIGCSIIRPCLWLFAVRWKFVQWIILEDY